MTIYLKTHLLERLEMPHLYVASTFFLWSPTNVLDHSSCALSFVLGRHGHDTRIGKRCFLVFRVGDLEGCVLVYPADLFEYEIDSLPNCQSKEPSFALV